jgi:ribosome-binding factor A
VSAAAKGTGGRGGRSRRGGGGAPVRRYPRAARINEVLRQVLADEIERLVDTDERLTLLTITAVQTDQDLRRATLLFSRLGPVEIEALDAARVRLQATIARQVRMKWTPLLTWAEDPAIVGGQRVEDILRGLRDAEGAGSERADGPVGAEAAVDSTGPVGSEAAVGDGDDDTAHGVA